MDIFSPPFVAGSRTSREAAASVIPSTPNLRARVLTLLRRTPAGLTDEEIQTVLGMNPSTQRPRRIELERMGLVFDSGRRRATQSGRMATVWYAPFTGEVVDGPPACGCTEDGPCEVCAR